MRKIFTVLTLYTFLGVTLLGSSGCTLIFQKGRRKDMERLNELQDQNQNLQSQLSELERAKAELEDRLRREIGDREVKVEMGDRGLVITFVAEVLFDSGKADLRSEALGKLYKVGSVLNSTVRDLNVGVEGHTDNVPIRHSGWKSNWELSSARAMSVVHYLIDEGGIEPSRLAGTGYGEYHPVDSNDSAQGRQRNRRVEIVILPKTLKEPAQVQQENLK